MQERIEADMLEKKINMLLQVLGIKHTNTHVTKTGSCQGEQVFLMHRIVISVTDLVHGDTRALLSNWGFSALCVILKYLMMIMAK